MRGSVDADCVCDFRIFESMGFRRVVRRRRFGLLCCGFELQKSKRRLTERYGMSKYEKLWKYIKESNEPQMMLTFDEIGEISGVPIDHSFLKYKKELSEYGYIVGKISMKAKTVLFVKDSTNL